MDRNRTLATIPLIQPSSLPELPTRGTPALLRRHQPISMTILSGFRIPFLPIRVPTAPSCGINWRNRDRAAVKSSTLRWIRPVRSLVLCLLGFQANRTSLDRRCSLPAHSLTLAFLLHCHDSVMIHVLVHDNPLVSLDTPANSYTLIISRHNPWRSLYLTL